jgi:hypothetical protein
MDGAAAAVVTQVVLQPVTVEVVMVNTVVEVAPITQAFS